MSRKKLYLIDGNSYAYRAFYALGNLATKDGRPTGAVYGFVTMLNKVRQERPEYLGVCFDVKGQTLRQKIYADYKIHRKPMPDDLQPQMARIKDIIAAYGIPVLQKAGYEADDVIATLAVQCKHAVDVYILSNDKDMLQLVDEHVKIYYPQKETTVVDAASVYERFHVYPNHITDLLALTGDSSDNIPGVPGIGIKTAAELIAAFGCLENILTHADAITQEKRKQLLKQYAEQARLSKQLATVITDVPLEVDLEQLRSRPEDTETLRSIFIDLEFHALARQFADEAPQDSGVFNGDTVHTVSHAAQCVERMHDAREVAIVFTPAHEVVLGGDERCFTRIVISESCSEAEVFQALAPLLTHPGIVKIGYDLKLLCVACARHGVAVQGPFFDVMVGAYLLEPSSGTRSLQDIAAAYLKRHITASAVCCELFTLKTALAAQLEDKGLRGLFTDIEMPLLSVLATVEYNGIRVDRQLLQQFGAEFEAKMQTLTAAIFESSGCEFNINSPKQLGEILFDRLKLPIVKRGKSGPSTNGDVLAQLSAQHPLPGMILEYRELAKLHSTYITGLSELIDARTGRIHTSFNQTVTATGRLSSSNPNLQNIPVRTHEGKKIRQAFTSSGASWKLVAADYSQIELRVLAHLAKDPILIDAFQQGRDIHVFTASLVFRVAESAVTDKMRDMAKRVNFGIVYGMGAHALAADIGVSFAEAREFISAYFTRYPAIKAFLDGQIAFAREHGYVTTLLNRRRYVPQINAKDAMQRGFAERVAMNTPIQGTAADLIKVAMINIDQQLRSSGKQTKMVLQVHDELVFDVPQTEVEAVREMIRANMADVVKLEVPIKVDIHVGNNWKELK